MFAGRSIGIVVSVLAKTAPLLVIPLGLLLGILISLISDFGLFHTVENIGLNPDVFAGQYGRGIVLAGWASVAVAFIVACAVVFESTREWFR